MNNKTEISVKAKSRKTGEKYNKIFNSYFEMEQWANKHDMMIYKITDSENKNRKLTNVI